MSQLFPINSFLLIFFKHFLLHISIAKAEAVKNGLLLKIKYHQLLIQTHQKYMFSSDVLWQSPDGLYDIRLLLLHVVQQFTKFIRIVLNNLGGRYGTNLQLLYCFL
jgi:hypothetical protein